MYHNTDMLLQLCTYYDHNIEINFTAMQTKLSLKLECQEKKTDKEKLNVAENIAREKILQS